LHFPKEFSYGYLKVEGNEKIHFKAEVAIAKFILKMQKKIWYYEKWVECHAYFPLRRSVKAFLLKPNRGKWIEISLKRPFVVLSYGHLLLGIQRA